MGFAVCAGAWGCNKIPGLAAKGDAASTAPLAGGGVLSFLDTSFEGEIAMTLTGKTMGARGGTPMTLTFGIKSPKVRVDIAGSQENPMLAQSGGFIIDPPAKKGFLLMPTQKKAMVIDFEKVKAQRTNLPNFPGRPRGEGTAALSEPPKIEKTGKKEVVSGYACETWKVTSKASHADMCVAEGIKWIDVTDLGLSSPDLALAAAALDLNHFPLRAVVYDDKNVEAMRMEATKIEKRKLEEAAFRVPADYQLIDMNEMLRNIQAFGAKDKGPAALPHKVR